MSLLGKEPYRKKHITVLTNLLGNCESSLDRATTNSALPFPAFTDGRPTCLGMRWIVVRGMPVKRNSYWEFLLWLANREP